MEQERRMIIIREIEHWRRSKLLPEQYCDFLLNLYAESSADGTKSASNPRKRAVTESSALQWLAFFGGIACITYVVLHFNAFGKDLQIGIFAFAAIAPYILGIAIRHTRPFAANISIVVGTGVLLIAGPLLLRYLGWGEWYQTALYLTGCSLLWLGVGVGFRMPWLHFCGWMSLFLSYALLLNRLEVPDGWITLELCWLPLSFLFGWLGWLFSLKAKKEGAVCLVVACLLWFMPEGYALMLTGWPETVAQLLLLGKLVLLGSAGFALRKIWIDWVV
jgi:hypothetical protein